MPRPPKIITVTRRIRKIIGITQDEMAKYLGVSRGLIEQVENETKPLSDDLLKRYKDNLGCHTDTTGKLSLIAGSRPYARCNFERQQSLLEALKELRNALEIAKIGDEIEYKLALNKVRSVTYETIITNRK